MSTYDPTEHEDVREERARAQRDCCEYGLRRVRVVMLFPTPQGGTMSAFYATPGARVVGVFGENAVKVIVEEPDGREPNVVVDVFLIDAGSAGACVQLAPLDYVYVGRAMTGDKICGGLLVYVKRKWIR